MMGGVKSGVGGTATVTGTMADAIALTVSVAVMFAVPSATAVTMAETDGPAGTLATPEFELAQVNVAPCTTAPPASFACAANC